MDRGRRTVANESGVGVGELEHRPLGQLMKFLADRRRLNFDLVKVPKHFAIAKVGAEVTFPMILART